MLVNNKMDKGCAVAFKNLSVGEAYYDKEDILCIKTSDPDWDYASHGECIAYIDGHWRCEEEHEDSKCFPLRTELAILGYKGGN